MPMISFRVLAVATLPLVLACAATAENGPTGSGGRSGTGGAITPGNGGTMAGTGGTSTPGTGGMNPSAGPGCGMGRTPAKPGTIENFDGQTQVVQWLTADKNNKAGTAVTPTGSLTVPVTGADTLAHGMLATWAMTDRPCMDASPHQGIQFKVSGTVSTLYFRISTPATIPVEEGGTCMNAPDCYAHYQKDVSTTVATGGVVRAAFSELMPPWGKPAAFDKASLIGLVFITADMDTTKSFTIDDVAFY